MIYLRWLDLRLWRTETLPVARKGDAHGSLVIWPWKLPPFVGPLRPLGAQSIPLAAAYIGIECAAATL